MVRADNTSPQRAQKFRLQTFLGITLTDDCPLKIEKLAVNIFEKSKQSGGVGQLCIDAFLQDIRFALRAEVQQRTEPIEAALSWLRSHVQYVSKSWTSLSSTIMVVTIAFAALRLLTHTPSLPPAPDLVKVAGLARSFEPLIFYSENGGWMLPW